MVCSSVALVKLAFLSMGMTLPVAEAREPDGLVVVSRHGVRRQFPSSTHDFAKYAPGKTFATTDEEWGVDGTMGVLTKHGYDAARLMGKYQGHKYATDGLKLDSCSDMFVYCEEDMPRDVFTAEAFFNGFFEGWKAAGGDKTVGKCHVPKPYFEEVEYLIDQGSEPRGADGQCRLGSEAEVQGVVGKVDEWTRLLRSKLQKLNDLLGCCDHSLCPADFPKDKRCTLLDMPHVWDEEHWYVTYTGPVYAGKYFSEWFLLNYLNGMDYAWKKLSEDDVMDLSAFVTEYRHFEFDLLAARPFGSALLMHVVAALEQMETGRDLKAVAHSPQVKLVYYAAHDTNLLYLAELLDLKWVSKGYQPNHTPPGGELIFEAYIIDGELNVAAFFDTATPTQVRYLSELTPENPPSRVAITIPGCSEGEELLCPLSKLRSLAIRSVDAGCITPPELVDYVSYAWAKDPVLVGASTAVSEAALCPPEREPYAPEAAESGGGGLLTLLLGLVAGVAMGVMGLSGYRKINAGGSDGGFIRGASAISGNKWIALSGLRRRSGAGGGDGNAMAEDASELLRSVNA